MERYTTLNNEEYDLDKLNPKHRKFIRKMIQYSDTNPHWNIFANYWLKQGQRIWGNSSIEEYRKKITNLPIFKICQDLESRLGQNQGHIKK